MRVRVLLAVLAFSVLALAYFVQIRIIARMIAQLQRDQPSRDFQWPGGAQILQRRERAVARAYHASHPRGALYGYWMLTNVVGGVALLTWLAIAVTLPD
ncbi:MAG: hypothetical protein H0U66_00470 [Gemmatimonadaceae bacterium]|nr:hypothetical protein [Gemmatimonadaceae bacterium]